MSNFKEDFGVLNKPAKMAKNGINQIIVCLKEGSKEVRDLLMHECDTVFECKVCRSLFRSLANFVVHKRGFCKEHCCEKMLLFENSDIPEESSAIVLEPETVPDNGSDQDAKSDSEGDEQTEVITSKAKIYSPLSDKNEDRPKKTSFKDCLNEISSKAGQKDVPDYTLKLKRMPSTKNAVLQAMYKDGTGKNDKKQVDELENEDSCSESAADINDRKFEDDAEGPDGESSQPANAPTDCDYETLTCNLCKNTFSSRRSLKRHMDNIHGEEKIFFPCLCCSHFFSSIKSVTRHLYNIHNKSYEQVKKLRSLSRSKSVYMRNKPKSTSNFDLKSDNVDQSVFMCPQCGRSFGRNQFLLNHQKYCKGTGEQKTASCPSSSSSISDRPRRVGVEKKVAADFVDSQTLNWRSGISVPKPNKAGSVKRIPWSPSFKSQPAAEPKTTVPITKRYSPDVIEEKVSSFLNLNKLQCRLCKKHFSSSSNLRRHVAIHLGWHRFKCKLCSFQAYNRFDVRVHVLKQHPEKKLTEETADTMVVNLKDPASCDEKEEEKKLKNDKQKLSPKKIENNLENDDEIPDTEVKPSSQECSELQVSPWPEIEGFNMSTLKTRSGTYMKEDMMQKFKQESNKDDDFIDESDKDEPEYEVLEGSAKRKSRPTKIISKKQKLSTQVNELLSASNMNNSSDEGEQRVSKRKQSFNNVLKDVSEEDFSQSPVSISRSSSLTNLRDSPKGLGSPLSRTNPNSPMRGVTSSTPKLVISDDLGRVVKEVLVDSSSPKKIRKPDAQSPRKQIVGRTLNFDNNISKGPRLQQIGLLRKLKGSLPEINIKNSPSSSQ